MSRLTLCSEIDHARHRVRITLSDEQLDKREVLFERNRDKYDAEPEKYRDHTWYAGSLLLLGELVQE